MSAPVVQDMTRTSSSPKSFDMELLIRRVEALEKQVKQLTDEKQSIPKPSLSPIKPPPVMKAMGKREQKKRQILAELEPRHFRRYLNFHTRTQKTSSKKANLEKERRRSQIPGLRRQRSRRRGWETKLQKQKAAEKAKLQKQKPLRSLRSRKPRRSLRSRKPRRSLRSWKPRRSLRSRKPRRSLRSRKPLRSWRSRKPRRSWRSRKPLRRKKRLAKKS